MNKRQQRRVAVTGIGMVTPLGNDTNATWQALLQGKSGIDYIRSFDASGFPTRIAAEVKNFSAEEVIPKQFRKHAVSFNNFALAAAEEAVQDAGLRPTAATAARWGLVVGSGMMTAEYSYWQRFQRQFAVQGDIDLARINKEAQDFYRNAEWGKMIPNSGLALLLQRYQIQGFATSVHTACASGGQALGLALQVIRRQDADYVLAGGFDSMINPVGLSSFCLLGALSTYNEAPVTASRPFDLTRNGFVLGEGAAFLVLENWEHAEKRGAKIYAELAGEGNSLSAYRITDSHPSGDGAIQAIEGVLRDAAETVETVDYINAHGTSTKMNDFAETNAIKAVFKERGYEIPCSSTKSQTGHLIAAAGALEGALSALAIHHGQLPMMTNLTTPDPECDLNFITGVPQRKDPRVVISNSFGFGGSNSCVLLRNPRYSRGEIV